MWNIYTHCAQIQAILVLRDVVKKVWSHNMVGCYYTYKLRAVGRSDNPGGPVVMWGHNLPSLVEIGLTDLPKSGGAMAPPAPPGTTSLKLTMYHLPFILGDKTLHLQSSRTYKEAKSQYMYRLIILRTSLLFNILRNIWQIILCSNILMWNFHSNSLMK